MEKTIRFVKLCPYPVVKKVEGKNVKTLFELSMYTTKQSYYAHATHKGKNRSEFVTIDAYGLLITEIYEENGDIIKREPIDLGAKTSHPRHINAFIHEVCRAPITDIEAVRDAYNEEAASDLWCLGWPDALAHAASVQLRRDLSATNLPPMNENIRKKREKFLQKLNPFRDLPIHDQNKGGFDA